MEHQLTELINTNTGVEPMSLILVFIILTPFYSSSGASANGYAFAYPLFLISTSQPSRSSVTLVDLDCSTRLCYPLTYLLVRESQREPLTAASAVAK